MEIKRGNDRLVILVPWLNVAVKLPRIYLKYAWKICRVYLKDLGWWKGQLFGCNVYSELSMKRFLFLGIYENWNEFSFYFFHRHTFCVPTFFSLFGLVNIQSLVVTCGINYQDLLSQMIELTEWEVRMTNPHHWEKDSNFTLQGGPLRMLDYGRPSVQKIILKYGQKIQDNFNPNYTREKRLKEMEEAKRS